MERKRTLILAGGAAATVLAAGTALAANLGLMSAGTDDGNPVGELNAADIAELAPLDETPTTTPATSSTTTPQVIILDEWVTEPGAPAPSEAPAPGSETPTEAPTDPSALPDDPYGYETYSYGSDGGPGGYDDEGYEDDDEYEYEDHEYEDDDHEDEEHEEDEEDEEDHEEEEHEDDD